MFTMKSLKKRIEAAAKRCGIDVEGFKNGALAKACREFETTGQIAFPSADWPPSPITVGDGEGDDDWLKIELTEDDFRQLEARAKAMGCSAPEALRRMMRKSVEKAVVRLEVPAGITDAEKRLFAALAERDGVTASEKLRELILSYTNSHLAP